MKVNTMKKRTDSDEKDLSTETNSSNWITVSENTVSGKDNKEDISEKVVDKDCSEGSLTDIKSLTGTYTVSESDDNNQVVVVPEHVVKTEECVRVEAEKPLETSSSNKTERTRANIPSCTSSKPYLRSHSGNWKNHRKKRQTKTDNKISASLPVDQPFQPNLKHSSSKENKEHGGKDDRKSLSSGSPPLPQVVTSSSSTGSSSSLTASSTTRISRSIENVISKLDRRSVSVLPQIGKSSPEGVKNC